MTNNIPKTNNYYQDERPLPALINKNDPKKTKYEYADLPEGSDEEYAGDFEEYWSDEEDQEAKRLTVKPTQKDLSDIMNLYKEKLNLGNHKYSESEGIPNIFLFSLPFRFERNKLRVWKFPARAIIKKSED